MVAKDLGLSEAVAAHTGAGGKLGQAAAEVRALLLASA